MTNYVSKFSNNDIEYILKDSNAVHKTGNENIGGIKTFTTSPRINASSPTLVFDDSDLIKGTAPSTNNDSGLFYYDKNNTIYGAIRYRVESSLNSYLRLETFKQSSTSNARTNCCVFYQADGKYYLNFGNALDADSGDINRSLSEVTNSTASTIVPTMGWVNNPVTSTNIVHRTGDEIISGVKSFNSEIDIGNTSEYKKSIYRQSNGNFAITMNKQDNSGWMSYITMSTAGRITINAGDATATDRTITLQANSVTAPTPATSDNSTKIATTAFVKNQNYISSNDINKILSVKENTFKIYQPTFSHEAFGMFFLFVFPNGHNILYDTGYINEENDINTFLSSLNITHLDVVIISHFHGDHAGCAPYIINNYCDTNTKFYKCMDCDPSQFTSNQSDVTTYENAYKTALTNKGFTYTIPENKSSVELFNGTVELTFYNTDTTNLQYYYGTAEMIENLSLGSTANNTSMCCLIRAYGTSIFMTGDIEYAGQKAIANYVPENVDILQIPHHAVNKNGYAQFFTRLNPKVSMFQKNNNTSGQETKYWWRYMKYNSDIPVINNATTTGIELECYNGDVKLLNGRIISMLGDLNDYNITHILPTPYDNVHNADEVATWTIADVVDMCQYGVKWDFRLGHTYNTTQLITEVNTLVPSTSWIITPHGEYISIQNRLDITKAEVKAKSVSEHS